VVGLMTLAASHWEHMMPMRVYLALIIATQFASVTAAQTRSKTAYACIDRGGTGFSVDKPIGYTGRLTSMR
jgi:hypothetical protein